MNKEVTRTRIHSRDTINVSGVNEGMGNKAGPKALTRGIPWWRSSARLLCSPGPQRNSLESSRVIGGGGGCSHPVVLPSQEKF